MNQFGLAETCELNSGSEVFLVLGLLHDRSWENTSYVMKQAIQAVFPSDTQEPHMIKQQAIFVRIKN